MLTLEACLMFVRRCVQLSMYLQSDWNAWETTGETASSKAALMCGIMCRLSSNRNHKQINWSSVTTMFVTIQNVVLMLLRGKKMSLNVAHAVGLVIKQSAEKEVVVTTACCYHHFTPLTLHYFFLLATKNVLIQFLIGVLLHMETFQCCLWKYYSIKTKLCLTK